MDSINNNYYTLLGINRDVSPFLMKDSDLLLSVNFYSRKIGAKKVRFGYAPFLDAIDNQPVRNLIYYNLPNESGLFRVSNSKIYQTTTFTGSWGSSVKTLTSDSVQGVTQMDGTVPYVHFTNPTDGYYTYDHAGGFKSWDAAVSGTVYQPTYLAAWQSRIYTDVKKRSLAQSAISFDLNTGYTTNPFTINANDPAGAGTVSLNAGNGGQIVGITSSIDRVQIYKQLGVVRFNGQTFMNLPYFGNILSVTTTKNDIDYFLATNGIYKNDGKQISLVLNGVQTILDDTLRYNGITNPVSFSFGDYTIFFVGTIRIGNRNNYMDIPNGCIVHHERFDQWDIWSLGHQMTAFGYYIDPTTNQPIMISGDVNGNTYVWGEQYSSDAGLPIDYHLRSAYFHFGKPYGSKLPHRFYMSMDDASGVEVNIATDYSDEYISEQGFRSGFMVKDYLQGVRDFKTISVECIGSTTTNRPEIYGWTISYKDQEERDNAQDKTRSKR